MALKYEDLYEFLLGTLFPQKRGENFSPKIGLEVEMIPYDQQKQVGANGLKRTSLADTKKALAPFFEASAWSEKSSYILQREGAQISFEPGGQIEYSSTPCSHFSELESEVKGVQKSLKEFLAKSSIELIATGIDPWTPVNDIPLQLKEKRYQFMEKYFESHEASMGRNMMTQTASMQICLDLSEKKELQAKQYLVSQLLAPYATGLFSNSPYQNGSRSEFESMRAYIWQNLDQSRTGFPILRESKLSSLLSLEECVRSYLDFALEAFVIFCPDEKGVLQQAPKGLSFKKWMEGGEPSLRSPTLKDFQRSLTLLFPEVRPKGFLELRSIDMQSFPWQMVPAIFYVGILYDENSLESAFEFLKGDFDSLISLWGKACYGLKDKALCHKAKKLTELSQEGVQRLGSLFFDSSHLDKADQFYERYTRRSKTPSSDYIFSC